MLELLLLFVPFFALVLTGWGAARSGVLPLEGIPGLNAFVLYFGLSAMVFRLAASGALMQSGLLGLLLTYGLAGAALTALALCWGVRVGLVRRDSGLLALVTAFPNTGFLGLPLLTGLLGPQAAGPLAATLVVDVLLLSSLCLAWAHSHEAPSHGAQQAPGADASDDPAEAWHAAQASLKGALRNPLLWAMALLSLSATPTALFTLGAVLARAQRQPVLAARPAPIWGLVGLKLVVHPLLVVALGWALRHAGMPLSGPGLLTMAMAAALPSASNVSMLAEREGANTALVARVILWTTALALLSLVVWSTLLGVERYAG